MWTRSQLDSALPTLARYTGLLMTVALIVAGFFVGFIEVSPGFVPATGLLLYKSITDAASRSDNENTSYEDMSFEDKWGP